MKLRIYLLLFFIGLGQLFLKAQVGQFPITANLLVNPPSTTYLSDYTALGSTRLQLNLFQNDFNEPDIDVRLKLTIEGNGITLTTDPNWAAPLLTTFPGSNIFSGTDLEGYLNPQNMIVNGIDPSELGGNGSGLPEGLYQFCVEVYNYPRTDVDIAAPSCFTTTLLKNYPPILVFPTCGNTVPVNQGAQNIQFQWQSNADANIMVEYLLTVAEVPEGMNPNQVLDGGQTPILDEEVIMGMNTFNYGPSFPELDLGKTYAYRIQVKDLLGLTTFENDGYSEVCTFDYGFSADGPVPVTGPEDAFLADVDNQATFTWNRPQEVLPSQELYYKLKVVEITNGQQRENAIQFNSAFYEETTDVLPFAGNLVLPPSMYPLPPEKAFAWQVSAFSDAGGVEVPVGKSEVRVIYTTPAVPRFKTGSPFEIAIEVVGLTQTTDVGDGDKIISGNGTAIVREGGETQQVTFENIKVTPYADSWQLAEGEIVSPVQSEFIVDIDNSGEESDDPDYNGNLEFHVENFVFTTADFHLEGRVNWFFPHATTEPNGAVVKSVFSRVLYNEYQILDNYILLEDHTFDLLEPNAFTINYTAGQETAGSRFNVTESACKLHLYGSLSPSTLIKDVDDERIKYNFEDADNPYYWENEDASADKDIRVVPNATMQLDAQHTIFDLSDIESPSRAADEAWMGIYFPTWKMHFPVDFDGSNQLELFEAQTYDFDDSQEDFVAFTDGGGLDVIINKKFEEGSGPRAMFNTFPDDLTEIELKMSDNSVEESFIDGFLFLPMISETEHFTYHVPFDNEGLQQSFLEDELIGREVVFGPVSEWTLGGFSGSTNKQVVLTIQKAVFEQNERISFTFDVAWKYFDIEASNIQNLKLWGDGNFGFNTPNGTIGISSISGSDKDLPLTIDNLKAGYSSSNKAYSFGLEASFVIGDEGSGISGLNFPEFDLNSDDDAPKTVLVAYRKGALDYETDWEGNIWADNANIADWGVASWDDAPSWGFPIWMNGKGFSAKGWIWRYKENEDFGSCVYGGLEIKLKETIQSPLGEIKGSALIGIKDDVYYFRADIGIGTKTSTRIEKTAEESEIWFEDTPNETKIILTPAEEKKIETDNRPKIGGMVITNISGRIYRHMRPADGEIDAAMGCADNMGSSVGEFGAEDDESLEDDGVAFFQAIPDDYEVDASTNFGFRLAFEGQDFATGGAAYQVEGVTEINWGSGGQTALKVFYYGGLEDTDDKESATMAGGGCITYSGGEDKRFTAEIYVKNQKEGARPKPLCYQAAVFIEIDNEVGLRKLAAGSRDFPMAFQTGCIGWTYFGWLKYEVNEGGTKTTELGLGASISKELKGSWENKNKKGKVRCGIEVGAEFNLTLAGIAEFEFPTFKPRRFELGVGASLELGGRIYGRWCPDFEFTLAEIYLGGSLVLDFVDKEGEIRGTARVKIGPVSPRVKFSKSFSI